MRKFLVGLALSVASLPAWADATFSIDRVGAPTTSPGTHELGTHDLGFAGPATTLVRLPLSSAATSALEHELASHHGDAGKDLIVRATIVAIPEPMIGRMLLAGLALVGLVAWRWWAAMRRAKLDAAMRTSATVTGDTARRIFSARR